MPSLLGAVLLALAAVPADATVRASGSYRIVADALTAGGGPSQSTSYSLLSSVGNPAGTSTSTSFNVSTGVLAFTAPAGGALDSDGDGVPDVIDNCPFDANPGQEDNDGDGLGDVCDDDDDNDGLSDADEALYGTDPFNPDTDGDGVSDGDEVAAGRNPLFDESKAIDYILDFLLSE